jgi:hypothetical protein
MLSRLTPLIPNTMPSDRLSPDKPFVEGITGYRLPATGYRLPATGYRLPATGYRLPANLLTGHPPPGLAANACTR